MNPLLLKEARGLLPILLVTVALMVIPFLLMPHGLSDQREGLVVFGYLAFALACFVMAGCAFGNEFQYRTVSLLLSQPVERSVVWRDKMVVLGAALILSLTALLCCRAACCPIKDDGAWVALVLIPLCAFCTAPYWTLLLRQEIGGMAFAVAVPLAMLMLVGHLSGEAGLDNAPRVRLLFLPLLGVYCAFLYWRGYVRFQRLEALEAPRRELALPRAVETLVLRPLTSVASRFRGVLATLLKKELRLQQTTFVLTGLFLLIALLGAILMLCRLEAGEGVLGGAFGVFLVILPLLAGAISVAEERGWDLAEWHLTLPPSALKQWSAKMLVALLTSLMLGVLLPYALVTLFEDGARAGTRFRNIEALNWVLAQLLVTSAAVYAATFSRSTLRAILTAFALVGIIGFAGVSLSFLAGDGIGQRLGPLIVSVFGPPPDLSPSQKDALMLGGMAVQLVFMLVMVQWLAWRNFRRVHCSTVRLWVQFMMLFLAFYLWMTAGGLLRFVVDHYRSA